MVRSFLLCIPLRHAAYIIAVLGFVYSLLCFWLAISIANSREEYLKVYANKMDILIVVVIYLSSTSHFMVTCIFLFVGTFLKHRLLVEIYLWSVLLHVFVNIVSTVGVSIYCMTNYQCFTGSGLGQSVVGLVLCLMYTMFWVYIISSLTSMMEDVSPH